MRKKVTRYRLAVSAAILLLLCLFASPSAGQEEKRVVRVGFFDLPGLQELAPNGTRSGYNYEYIMALAAWAGWRVEFVDGSFPKLYEMLVAQKIDILGAVQRRPDREQKILFPGMEAGNSYSRLMVRNDAGIAFEDFAAFDGMKIGIQKGNSNESDLLRYARSNRFSVKVARYETDALLSAALQGKEIDAILSPSVRTTSGEREVARFGSRPFYFAVAKDESELLRELDAAHDRLMLSDPMFQNRLLSKYTVRQSGASVVFSGAERKYIEEHPVIRVVYRRHGVPIEFQNPKTGKEDGVVPMIMRLVSARTGLKVEFVPADNYDELKRLLVEGRADVACVLETDEPVVNGTGIRTTRPYVSIPMVRLSNPAVLNDVCAVVQGGLPDFWLSRLTFGKDVVEVGSAMDCIEALFAGDVSIAYIDTFAANYYLANPKFAGLNLVAVPDYAKEIRMGVAPNSKPELLSVFNKALSSISAPHINEMLFSSLLTSQPFTLRAFIARNPATALGLFGSVVIAITSALLAVIAYRERAAKRTWEMLYADPLTGGWSIQRFREDAEALLQTHPEMPFAVVYIDIDQFKYINDEYGYEEGDRVLRAVSAHLSQKIGKFDRCARITADHFALLVRTPEDEAIPRITFLFAGTEDIPQMNRYQLSISAGVYMRKDGECDISAMLDRANYARSEAKQILSEDIVMYNETIRKNLHREKEMEGSMRRALADGEFVPYFQPKVDMLTGRLVGAEVLVRWLHPEKGIVPPDAFIPTFEKNGFITNIDMYMFSQACASIRDWLQKGWYVEPVSCNFSRLHMRDKYFCEKIMEIADRHKVPPPYLELEITESMAMENVDSVISITSKLKRNGFRIAIDDFGAGYSSLRLLQQIPAHVLKLDKHFITEITHLTERAIVEGVVEIAHKLDMNIVCEGVEQREQTEYLKSIGCRYAQGSYYAVPMPLKDFEAYMNDDKSKKLRTSPLDTRAQSF